MTGHCLDDGTLQVILLGASDGLPYLTYQSGSGAWYWYGQLPNPGVPFSALTTGSGNGGSYPFECNLQVIGLGASDGLPYLIYQVTQSGTWHWYGALPDPGVRFSAIATGRSLDGFLHVVGIGASDGLPYLLYQAPSGAWDWYGQLPNPCLDRFSALATGVFSEGWDLVMIGLSTTAQPAYAGVRNGDAVWFGCYTLPHGDPAVPFSALASIEVHKTEWYSTGDSPNAIVIGLGANDNLPYQIARDYSYDGTNYHFFWSWKGPLPDPNVQFSAIATGIGNSGSPQLIGLGANDGIPYLIYASLDGSAVYPAFNGTWHWYGQLPVPTIAFSAVATGIGNDENLQVVLLSAGDGIPYLVYQVHSSGAWYWYGRLPVP